MRISHQTFATAVTNFVLQRIVPSIQSPWMRWAVAGASGIGAFTSPSVLQALKMAGVADEQCVDVDRLSAFIGAAFDMQPVLPLPGFPMPVERCDGEALIAWLKQQQAIPNVQQPMAQQPMVQQVPCAEKEVAK